MHSLGTPSYKQGALDVTCAAPRQGCARADAHRVPWEHMAALGTACKPRTRCAVPAWLVGDTREPQPQLTQRSGQFWEHRTCPILMAPRGLSPTQGWDMASGPCTPPPLLRHGLVRAAHSVPCVVQLTPARWNANDPR